MAGDPMDSLLMSLIEKEIPDGRNALLQSHDNLAELSEYCRENYINSADKSKALQETKEFASQSLASVAYQIHSLAVNILQMMDQQTIQLQKMQSNANNIGLLVDIHKEKVARREIGVLTSSKNFSRSHKVVPPAQPEKLKKYKREEIDYTSLDNIGHGVKSERKEDTTSQRRFSTSSSSGSLKENSTSSVHSSSQGSLQGLQGSLYHASSSERKAQFGNTMPPPPRPPIAPVAPFKPKSSYSGPPGPTAPPTPVMAAPPSPSTSNSIPVAPPPPAAASSVLPPPPPPSVTVPEPDYDGKYSSNDSTSTTYASTAPTSTLNQENSSSSERPPKRISTIYPIVPPQPPKTQSVSIAIMSSPVSSRSSSRSSNRSCPVVSALPTFSPGEPLTPTGLSNASKSSFPAFVESQDYSDESDEDYDSSTIVKSPLKSPSSKSSMKSLFSVKSAYSKSPTKNTHDLNPMVYDVNTHIPPPPAPPPPPVPNSASAAIPTPPPPPPVIFGSATHHSSIPTPPPPPPPPGNPIVTKNTIPAPPPPPPNPKSGLIPMPPPLPQNDDHSPDEYPTVKKRPPKIQPPPRTPPYSPLYKLSPTKGLNPRTPPPLSMPLPPPMPSVKNEEPEYAVPFKVTNLMNMHRNEPNLVAKQRDSHEQHNIHNGYNGHNGFHDMDPKGLPAPPPPPPPEDFYQVPPNNTPVAPMTPIEELPPPPPDNLYEMVGDENHYESVANPNVLPPPPPMLTPEGHIIPDTYEEKVVAIYDYQKLREDELELSEGDVIYVIKKNEDGWFEGIKDGIQGLFPGNYVTPYM